MQRPPRQDTGRTPTDIKLHRRTARLAIQFDDGARFELPAEYLRVYSPSAEVRGHGPGEAVLVTGKEHVGIQDVEPVGQYAVRLIFDDGHSSGLYSWDLLYDLGTHYDHYWRHYLDALQRAGHQRGGDADE